MASVLRTVDGTPSLDLSGQLVAESLSYRRSVEAAPGQIGAFLSSPWRESPDGLVVTLAVTIGLGAVVAFWSTGTWAFIALALVALILELAQFARHDRRHRARGEPPHAMWGTNDKNRPKWLRR